MLRFETNNITFDEATDFVKKLKGTWQGGGLIEVLRMPMKPD